MVWITPGRGGLSLALCPAGASPSRGARIGVEHEYRLWRGGAQQDFRTLLPQVASGLRTIDPGDPRARRLSSGCALTADGWEAEIATPPLPVTAGLPEHIDGLLALERTRLAREVAGHRADRLTGFSTHVNVSVADDRVVDIGRAFVRHCALATVAVGEPRTSGGLLVRPRRGRLEVGGEYAEGADLVALLTFVASAVAALVAGDPPPPTPEPVVAASREKFGWFVVPVGPCRLILDEGSTPAARRWFADTWRWARPHGSSQGLDPAPVDRLATGAPWRAEASLPADLCTLRAGDVEPERTPYEVGGRTRRGGIDTQTTWLTWQHVVWGCYRGDLALYAVLPVECEEEFLRKLDAGDYDALLERELTPGRRTRRRLLAVHDQLTGPAWWHDVRPGALVPAERGPAGRTPRVSYRRARRSWPESTI